LAFSFLADLTFGLEDLLGIMDNSKSFDLFFNIGYACIGIAVVIRLYYDSLQNNIIPRFPFLMIKKDEEIILIIRVS